jgi:hypothetical protein
MKTSSLLVARVVHVVALLSLTAVFGAPFAHSQVSFYGTPTIAGCAAAVIGDFNRDGNLDIINCAGTVLLGNGNGTFTTGTTLSNVPSFVADFNGDGIPDVLAFSQSGNLFVYLGNGDGTFQAPKETYTGVPLYTPGLAVADLVTGNNDADVVVPNPAGGILVFLGKGDGTFAAPVNYASPYAIGQFFVGDFTGDGKADILSAESGGVFVLPGNGDGTFQAAKITTFSGQWSVVAVGALNGGSTLDLVVDFSSFSTSLTETAVMLGNGDGTFQQPTDQFTTSTVSSSPVLADVNGDGNLDLLIQSFPFLQVYLGNGNGVFTAAQAYSYNSVSLTPGPIFVGDFDNDGKPDVTASQSILFGNGDGTFQASTAVVLPNGDQIVYSGAVIGDFNGDGRSDLALTGASGNLYIYLAGTTGTLSLAHTYSIPGGSLQTGDFNGDGKLDLITTVNSGGTLFWAVLLGNGDGSFGAPVESDACPPPALTVPAIGDLNGDHKSDLALPSGESLSICLGNGDGTFASPVNYFYGTGPNSVVLGDFTNNGILDAVVAGGSEGAIFLGNGDGTFQGVSYLTACTPGNPLADFNGDGNLDGLGGPGLCLGNGKGGFQPETVNQYPFGGIAVDLNGNGYIDLVYDGEYIDGSNSATSISLGNGNGTFQAPLLFQTAGLLTTFGLSGDFNGDGRPDLAVSWGYFREGITPQDLVGVQILPNTTPPAPGASVSRSALTFPSQPVGTTSSPLGVTVSNIGKGVLTVSGVKFSGANASEFSHTNNCTSVQPGAACTINVVFTPTAGGSATASLAINDNVVGSPQTVALSGTATAPTVTVTPSALAFPAQAVGTSSSPASVTLNNTSSKAVLTVSSVAVTGADASQFSQTNNCTMVEPGSNCTIKVVFTPTVAASATASLGITDNAEGSPQAVDLSGTGTALPDFAIGPASGSSNSATITAGQTASFDLAVTPAGSFSGTVSLSCAITPAVTPAPLCTVPSSVNVTEGTAAAVTAKISTTPPGTAGSISQAKLPPGISGTIILLASGLLFFGYRRRMPILAIPMTAVLLFGLAACGGGGSSSTKTQGTPAGTYTATFTAKSGSLSHSTTATVVVQ